MAETYESKINSEHVQGWTRRTVADGDYLQSKTIQPLVNRDSILAKGLDDTNTLINGMSDKVDDVETKCNAQEALVKSLSGDVEDFCASATEAFEQIKANEQTLAGNVESVQQSVKTLSGDIWNMNFMGFKDSTTVFVKEEIEQGKHMFSFSSVGGGGGGTSYDMAWYPTVDSTGKIEWAWNPTTIAPPTANIKGPKGEDGPDGKTPVLSANNYNLYWKYSDATTGWTDLGNFRGAQGETGEEGADGASPTVEIEGITGEDNRTGNKITFHYGEGLSNTTSYSAWDGLDGQGATVNLFGDKGIEVIHPAGSTNYTVGLSGGYYAPTLSAGSANKAGYSELAGSATYAEKFKVDNTDYTFSNLYSEIDTLSNASGRWDAYSALSATKLDKTIWDSNSGKFATSADLDENIQYAMTTNGWEEITGGGGTVYDIIGNNGISAKKDTANDRYEVGLSGDYVKKSGDTVSGQLVLSGANYDDYYVKAIRGSVNGYAKFGMGGNGGAVIKADDGTNNAQMIVKADSTAKIEILLQHSSNQNIGHLYPMSIETAGWTPTGNDNILHIVLDS